MPWYRETSPICEEAWLSAASITPAARALAVIASTSSCGKTAVVEAGEQDQIAIGQGGFNRRQHPALNVGVWRHDDEGD